MKRLLAVLVFVPLFFQIFIPHALAQTPAPSTSPAPIPGRLNSDVPQNYGTHTQMLLIEVIAALSCQLAGVDPVNPTGKCLGVDPVTGKIGFVEGGGGVIGIATNMIAGSFNIPISGTNYARNVASDFGITKRTYAQENTGEGFDKIEPLMKVWVPFRNVVYVLFVVAFMLIGFGIVFRFKIDTKVAMTVQNSIPKIIITLILVTFSFAIAGFLIDVMYLFIYILFELFSSIEGVRLGDLSPGQIQNSTPFGALGAYGGVRGLVWNAAGSLGDILESITRSIIDKLFGGIIGGAIGFFAGPAVDGIASVITFLIFFIAAAWALFRLWFILFKSYLFIIIDIIISPVWIVGSLIPGSPLTAGSWFRHIFKYIAVFPVTFFMFLLGAVLVQLVETHGQTQFVPPLIGVTINPTHLGALMGLAILLMTPEVINMIQDVMKAPVNKYQASIGRGLSVGSAVSSAPAKKVREQLFKKDADGTPTGPGSLAQKYLWNATKSKIGSKIPSRIKSGVDASKFAKWKLREDQSYRDRTGREREGAIERRNRENERIASEISNNNMANIVQRNGNNININIAPNFSDEETRPIAEQQNTGDPNRDWQQAQQILHGQVQQIQAVQNKLNTNQPLTDADMSLFQDLASNLSSDARFAQILEQEKINSQGTTRTAEEIRRLAITRFQQMLPVHAGKYALRDVIRQRTA